MKFGLNYSETAAKLTTQGLIRPDVFKCPAWPELITRLRGNFPIYIHFPLGVGAGIGDAIDVETKRPADWPKFERLLEQTDTPYLNLHILSEGELRSDTPESENHITAEQVQERMIRDVESVVSRFGKEMIILENGYHLGARNDYAIFHADTITRVVEETGTGFLFDISHARMAAMQLGLGYREYIAALPLHAVREIHVTGIQVVNEYWIQRAEKNGLERSKLEKLIGPDGAWLPNGMIDHLPLTNRDWSIMKWAAMQLQSGSWQKPWVVSLECGGIGPFWEATFSETEMLQQVPRLQELFEEKT